MRRIVTGHNSKGKSVILIDGPPSRSIGEEVGGLFEIWNTDSKVTDRMDKSDKADIDIVLSPDKSCTKFRYFQINPTPDNISDEILNELAEEAFKQIGAAHHRVDVSRHHAMHETGTIDYIILLEGDITLILDEDEVDLKPFDVVVQRGTNHAWRNNGKQPATLIAVLIDSDFDE
ncbi:MAG: cupin domain-containing protein [SAR86 cluster bacterium]|nr:cupin domain-containing protein [SAR86 cluster bacterium]